MRAAKPEMSSEELRRLILDVLEREARPVTVTEMHRAMPKALRPAAKALTAIVGSLVEAKQLFRTGRRISSTPDRTLHLRIVAAVTDRALAASELAKSLHVSVTRVRQAIHELVTSGELHPHPKQKRVVRYGAHAPTATDLLRPAVDQLIHDARKLGIDDTGARAALRELLGMAQPARTSSATAEVILDAILALNPQARDGALVYLPHLRTATAGSYSDRYAFDAAVLALLARGNIQLQSHPTPSTLSAAERGAMIENGRGGYYSAIGLR